MVKIGDTVRFLNDIGGGTVTKVDSKKNIVFVEDEDGFEIPILANECVVVGEISQKTNFPKPQKSTKQNLKEEKRVEEIAEKNIVENVEPIYETVDGDELNVILAFLPDNVKNIEDTAFDCFLVNDSNYFLFYNFVIGLPNNRKSVANGIIEPNTQIFLTNLQSTELNDWNKTTTQITAFKREKNYKAQRVIDFDLKMPLVKFHKYHSFSSNDYFDEPSLIINIVKENQKEKIKEIPAETIKEAMLTKKNIGEKRKKSAPHNKSSIIEVDLHITELIDNTAGMSSADILNYQLEVFQNTIKANEKNKGQKIVFIHGKGEGILRKKITNLLRTKYKNLKQQDASFKEYGFGATMVIV